MGGSSKAQRIRGRGLAISTPIVLTGQHSRRYEPEKQGEVGVIGDEVRCGINGLRDHHRSGLCAASRALRRTSSLSDTDPERGKLR
jgi:hypothetical protein